jgi:ubiquinol-cytochrome c reductase cytochrome c subunit
MNRSVPAVLVAACSLALFTACAYFGRETAPYRPEFSEVAAGDTGKEVYQRDCAWCHGAQGQGTPRGPDLISGTNGPALTHSMLTTGRMPLRDPDERSEREARVYTEEEIDAILLYTSTFGAEGPAIPHPDLEEGDLGEGLELYQENCAACHSTTLIGGALTSGSEPLSRSVVAPALREATPTEVAEAMLTGPGPMPVFGLETFTQEEVNSIVKYVEHQRDPTDRGGAPVGHVGPVAEGAVGWIVGLGLLLLLIRWIGTRGGEL